MAEKDCFLAEGRVALAVALVVSLAAVQYLLSKMNLFKLFQTCRARTDCNLQVTVKIRYQILPSPLKLACAVPHCHKQPVTVPWYKHPSAPWWAEEHMQVKPNLFLLLLFFLSGGVWACVWAVTSASQVLAEYQVAGGCPAQGRRSF